MDWLGFNEPPTLEHVWGLKSWDFTKYKLYNILKYIYVFRNVFSHFKYTKSILCIYVQHFFDVVRKQKVSTGVDQSKTKNSWQKSSQEHAVNIYQRKTFSKN